MEPAWLSIATSALSALVGIGAFWKWVTEPITKRLEAAEECCKRMVTKEALQTILEELARVDTRTDDLKKDSYEIRTDVTSLKGKLDNNTDAVIRVEKAIDKVDRKLDRLIEGRKGGTNNS